jgi:hypothetical protein
LYEHLARAFSGDKHVEVILDRRSDSRANPPWITERLRSRGVAVIRRAESQDEETSMPD